jgi:thiamine transporter ThiT
MAHTQPEFHHGGQDTTENLESYRLFLAIAKWGALHLAVVTVVLTLWFCTGAGFFGGLIPGIVLMVLGIWLLRSRHPREP